MDKAKIFISYSHADEWLKDELVKHLSALKHRDLVDVWHDRLIPPGGILDQEIDDLLLVSTDFLASNYCFNTEYAIALERRDLGEAVIVPIIVRDCDWDAKRLRTFNALPPDGRAVTRGAGSRADAQQRDAVWLEVINGLKVLLEDLKKSLVFRSLTKRTRVTCS